MKPVIFFFFLCFFSFSVGAQTVLASGQEPAWILDWDGNQKLTLYIGETSSVYTLVSMPAPEGSSREIAESWVMKTEDGKTAILVMEYFDPESAESCPCFHDMGEGLNRGKAYLITENGQFYIGCGEFLDQEVVSNE